MRNTLGPQLALHPSGEAESCHVRVERDGVTVKEIWNKNRVSEKVPLLTVRVTERNAVVRRG
jgi:hypothetical protein